MALKKRVRLKPIHHNRVQTQMNIFYFDSDFEICARDHCDVHVIKMILESAQILCTVLWLHDIAAPYRPTHQRHPSVLWANQSLSNWCWLKALAGALNKEYQYRFHHDVNHRSYDVIESLPLPPLPDMGLTEMPQVMPPEYQHACPVTAYRRYFMGCKTHLAKWKKRPAPLWFNAIH